MAEGWISVHRKIKKSWIWQSKEKFDRRSAWIDLILSANHRENKILVGANLLDVKRGEFITSEVKLAERWKWGRTAVRTFLKLLESDGMIIKKVVPNKFITITILNYDKYQNQTTKDTTEDTTKTIENTEVKASTFIADEQQINNCQTTDEQQPNNYQTTLKQLPNTNNNENKENNDNNENKDNKNSVYLENPYIDKKIQKLNIKEPKIKFAEFVYMTECEYEKLIKQFGAVDVQKMISRLDNYKGSKGKIYKSDYRAILNWVVDAVKNDKNRITFKKSKESRFCDYEQRKYDGINGMAMGELEMKLLGWDSKTG